MTSQGSAYARFRRALLTRNMGMIDPAARELPAIALDDALRILAVMAEQSDPRYPRAAARWAARVTTEQRLGMAESRDVLALLGMMPKHPEAALVTLREYV